MVVSVYFCYQSAALLNTWDGGVRVNWLQRDREVKQASYSGIMRLNELVTVG